MRRYSLYQNVDDKNIYVAFIQAPYYGQVEDIYEELRKDFIIVDDDYEGPCITLWLKKKEEK